MKLVKNGILSVFGLCLGLIVCQSQGMDQKSLKKAQNSLLKGFYPQSLSDFSKTGQPFGAGVMPYYEENGEIYVLLGREVNSRHKREWALFSGGSEQSVVNPHVMEHPLDCAAREFYEEAILHKTLGWAESDVKEYIKNNTTEVIAQYSRDVHRSRPLIIYQVKFQKKQIERIVDTFKNVFNDVNLDEKFKEKDALAVVKYQDLIDTVKKNETRVALDKKLPYWFNKDEEDKALIFYMPYNLLRARYAPSQEFKSRGKEYHYIQDVLSPEMQKKNYQFFAQEEVKALRSKL